VISSIKGNIGHCEAASGAAGLAKLLIMLREKTIPMQVGFKEVNPCFSELESSGFIIPRHTSTWNHSKKTPRRAMLNNFGAAGSNTSLLLEEWANPRNSPHEHLERSAYVFTLSAKSKLALETSVHRHLNFLKESEHQSSLKDICYTATARRQIHDYRVSLVCSSIDELRTKLDRSKVSNSSPVSGISSTIFVFSGQGSVYQGMGEELMHTYPAFKEIVMTCEKFILEMGFPSIIGILQNSRSRVTTLDDSEQIIASQCACFVLEYALARMFMSWGVIPRYVMGHR